MSLKTLSPGKNPPSEINAIIEIPAGSSTKYEVDPESGVIFVDRFLHTPMFYPFNYGFIPSTAAEDGDPVDIIVLSSQPIAPGCAIKCTPIAVLEMEDEEGMDNKLVAVPPTKIDPLYGTYQKPEDIPTHIKNQIKHFFENYKSLEPSKWVKVTDWQGREAALKEVEAGIKAFKKPSKK